MPGHETCSGDCDICLPRSDVPCTSTVTPSERRDLPPQLLSRDMVVAIGTVHARRPLPARPTPWATLRTPATMLLAAAPSHPPLASIGSCQEGGAEEGRQGVVGCVGGGTLPATRAALALAGTPLPAPSPPNQTPPPPVLISYSPISTASLLLFAADGPVGRV
jgi:hypothetical protein